jgi:phospholipid/cholesterol/gamma-HCH transport system substrate-binding protein
MPLSRSIQVGIFVLAGIVLAGVATFMIGDTEHLWNRKVEYQAAFNDVAGLKPGSPVSMGGVDIGRVDTVAHAADPSDRRIYVKLQVERTESVRVLTDTKAQILGKGLLGDKMVDLSTDGKGAPLLPNGMLSTAEPLDFTSALGVLATKADHAITNVEQTTELLNDPKLHEDVRASLDDMRAILDGIVQKDSAAHRLLLDPTEGARIDHAITSLQESTEQLNAAIAAVHDVADHLKTGPGLAHALIYDGEISQNAAGAVAEVHKDLEAVRTGNGLAHSLIYGDDATQHVMGNVDAMTGDLRAIVHDVRQGKGTLGALLVDPSVYEDIRSLVGNVERNEVLRALVRYSIKADEANQHAPRVDAARVSGGSSAK